MHALRSAPAFALHLDDRASESILSDDDDSPRDSASCLSSTAGESSPPTTGPEDDKPDLPSSFSSASLRDALRSLARDDSPASSRSPGIAPDAPSSSSASTVAPPRPSSANPNRRSYSGLVLSNPGEPSAPDGPHRATTPSIPRKPSLSRTNSASRPRPTRLPSRSNLPPAKPAHPVGATPRTAQPMAATELFRRLDALHDGGGGELPLLVVDVRSLSSFLGTGGRLQTSINVNFPSLLIKRFRRGNTSNFALSSFIATELGKDIFVATTALARLPGSLDGVDVVVVDKQAITPSDEGPGGVLLSVLERRAEVGGIFWLENGFESLTSVEGASRWVTEGEEDEEAHLLAGPSHRRSAMPRLPSLTTTLPHVELPMRSPSTTPLASPQTPGGTPRLRPPKLRRLDTSETLLGGRGCLNPVNTTGCARASPRVKTGPISLQALCHSQSKTPLHSAKRFKEAELIPPPDTARPHSIIMSGTSPPTTPKGETDPFTISVIIPGFLFLGPDPVRAKDLDELEQLGVKEVLNMAVECEDHDSAIAKRFTYTKIPMRDFVEETDVDRSILEGCRIIATAQLHSKPVYVHCRAGKSRSATIVLAYLIHRNHWSLKRAFAHVIERRSGISPNIGFISELMKWEERERGFKSTGMFGVNAPTPSFSPPISPHTSTSYFPPGAAVLPTELSLDRRRQRDSLDLAHPGETGITGGKDLELRDHVEGGWSQARSEERGDDFLLARRASRAGLESNSSTLDHE